MAAAHLSSSPVPVPATSRSWYCVAASARSRSTAPRSCAPSTASVSASRPSRTASDTAPQSSASRSRRLRAGMSADAEPVPGAPHGLQADPARPRDLAAQVAYVDVDDVALGLRLVRPGAAADLGSSEDLVGVTHEELQQRGLAHGQLDPVRPGASG